MIQLMPYKFAFIFISVFFASFTTKGQGIKICDDLQFQKAGVVHIIADTQLVHDIKPAQVGDDGPQMNGYRIQVYGETDRDAAQRMKDAIAMIYGVRTYMIYESPYFKVRVGDFRSRMEAQQMFHTLKQKYTGILLVPGLVNLPDLK